MSDRLDKLRALVDKSPDQPMPRYGVAMELKRRERLAEAIDAFRELLEGSPDFVPAYYQLGGTLVQSGREEDAREVFAQGLEKADQAGNAHAADELRAALDELED